MLIKRRLQSINGLTCSEKRKRESFLSEDNLEDGRAERMKAADDFEHLLKQLSGILTPKQLTIFLLKDVFSFQLHEIAETLGKPESSVKSLLFRSRQRLKRLSPEVLQKEPADGDDEHIGLLVRRYCITTPMICSNLPNRHGVSTLHSRLASA